MLNKTQYDRNRIHDDVIAKITIFRRTENPMSETQRASTRGSFSQDDDEWVEERFNFGSSGASIQLRILHVPNLIHWSMPKMARHVCGYMHTSHARARTL